MEEMYEVLKFVEHGAHCRQSMDCVRGMILISFLKGRPRISKEVLFEWFRRLCVSVDQYHRSRGQRDYRYLNPYSVVVSEEGTVHLLDLEAPENGTVVKQMQRRAVRERFVKPVCGMPGENVHGADLFTYGRTIQFMLACTRAEPELTLWEEMRLLKIIRRCTGESGKEYENMKQVLRALPAAGRKEKECKKKRKEYIP